MLGISRQCLNKNIRLISNSLIEKNLYRFVNRITADEIINTPKSMIAVDMIALVVNFLKRIKRISIAGCFDEREDPLPASFHHATTPLMTTIIISINYTGVAGYPDTLMGMHGPLLRRTRRRHCQAMRWQ